MILSLDFGTSNTVLAWCEDSSKSPENDIKLFMGSADQPGIHFRYDKRDPLNLVPSCVCVRGEQVMIGREAMGQNEVVVDLKDVDYISSAGWGIFIGEIKDIRHRGGDLKLSGMVGDVYEVFQLLEFHSILQAYDTSEEAISSFATTAENHV